jgi:hypothetical protein
LNVQAVSQFVVRVCDLVEAEGNALRTAVRGEASRVRATASNLAMGAAFLLVSVPLLVAGVCLVGAGLMLWLETVVGRPLAACLTGLVMIASGGGCFMIFRSLAERRPK